MLDFDNTAFHYFALTVLCFYLIPSIWYTVSELYAAFLASSPAGSKARTSAEQEKADRIRKEATGFTRLAKWSFIINLIGLIGVLILFCYLLYLVSQNGEMARFDPFAILGIENGATDKEIKKAYRQLSLRYHPDKNPGDKAAEEMFMKLAKAHDALLDPISKENYEKYGSPDGKQALEVSIGLPSIMLDNPKIVLVLYLITLVLIVPLSVRFWYSFSKRFTDKGVLFETNTYFYHLLQAKREVVAPEVLPEILASACELREINANASYSLWPESQLPKEILNNSKITSEIKAVGGNIKELKTLMKSHSCKSTSSDEWERKQIKMPKEFRYSIVLGNMLLHTQTLRLTSSLCNELSTNLNSMLLRVPEVINGMYEVAKMTASLKAMRSSLLLGQYLTQALWITSTPFLQCIPTSSNSDTDRKLALALQEAASKGKQLSTTAQKNNCFKSFLHLSDDEAANIIKKCCSNDAIIKDILSIRKLLPAISITTKVFVEEDSSDNDFFELDAEYDADVADIKNDDDSDDQTKDKDANAGVEANGDIKESKPLIEISGDDIYEQDLATIKVTINRKNTTTMNNKEVAEDVHAPLFPRVLKETWHVLLISNEGGDGQEKEQLRQIASTSEQSAEVSVPLKFQAPDKEGEYEWKVHIISENYVGMDEIKSVKFNVKPRTDLPEYEMHPEDKELDNEPSLFEQIMVANADDEDSSDSDSDSEDEGEGQGDNLDGNKKKN